MPNFFIFPWLVVLFAIYFMINVKNLPSLNSASVANSFLYFQLIFYILRKVISEMSFCLRLVLWDVMLYSLVLCSVKGILLLFSLASCALHFRDLIFPLASFWGLEADIDLSGLPFPLFIHGSDWWPLPMSHLLCPWRCRQFVPLERWLLSVRLHDIISEMRAVLTQGLHSYMKTNQKDTPRN